MTKTIKITSKRQITIPSQVFSSLGLAKGDRLVVEQDQNKIVIQKAQSLLDQLAGSIQLPKKFQKLTVDEIITEAKKRRFRHKS